MKQDEFFKAAEKIKLTENEIDFIRQQLED